MRPRRTNGRLTAWPRAAALAAALACGYTLPASAEYRLGAGDTLELAVAGLPEWRQRVVIQIDGTVSVAGVGTVQAAGSTIRQVQSAIEATLTNKVLRSRGADGRERQMLLQPGDVAVAVAEYRPVSVGGDVQTPGQYAFRPQMTVRHALAASGGVSLVRGRVPTNGLDAVEFDRERTSILLEFARETAHAWRLEAELRGADMVQEQPLGGVPAPQPVLAEAVRIETRELKVSLENLARERAYLVSAAAQADEQIAMLLRQDQEEKRGVEADMEELERVTKLLGTGSVVNQRVTDSRRAVLLSSTRRLQTSTRLVEVRQLREELLWRQAKLGKQRELEILQAIRETRGKLADLIARLGATGQKLALVGRSQTDTVPLVALANLFIIRRAGGAWDRVVAHAETELQPGDAVEVELKRDRGTLAAIP